MHTHLQYEITQHDFSLIWKYRTREYLKDRYGGTTSRYRWYFVVSIVITLFAIRFLLVGAIEKPSILLSGYFWIALVLLALFRWVMIDPNPLDRDVEKNQLREAYQASFDVTISDEGILAIRSKEEPFSIQWEDVLSCDTFKQLIFIEHHERYNFLVIPESAFPSAEQEDELWELFETHVRTGEVAEEDHDDAD